MIEGETFTVREGGVRLDAAVLLRFPTSTRAFVREAIESGAVRVDARRAAKGLKLRGGETVEIRALAESADNTVAPNAEVRVREMFCDDALLAYDKPAGMPVQPLSRSETSTLMNGVVARHPECIPLGDRPLLAGAVHRIDADTSGLVLVARTAAAFDALRAQFAAQSVEKTYLALVEGIVAAGGTLENDLAHDPTLPFCRMIDLRRNRLTRAQCEGLRPLHAVTAFRPVKLVSTETDEQTLLEITIFTGVTHQIRAQLALAGLHIVNDRLYGAFAVEGMTGHRLHALAAKFAHPASGAPVEIRTPLPDWAR
ncbi:MAG: RluA family pseudouridine synthase [Kiritimatiellae bacterium]|nr:RluA family pseudouridine synthase [Kiritimatiellia bacterium]